MKNILSVFNVLSSIRIRLYPLINRLILKQNGAVVGCNVCIPGKVHWQISKGGEFALETISIFHQAIQ